MLREQSVEQQNTNKFKNDNHKLKQEIDVAKDNLEQSEKKSRKITDDMKSKLERTEIEQEMNIKKISEERNQLKKKNKDLLKGVEVGNETGTINKEALTRAQIEYENQINELKLLIDEERKNKNVCRNNKKTNRISIKRSYWIIRCWRKGKKETTNIKKKIFTTWNGWLKRFGKWSWRNFWRIGSFQRRNWNL